MFTNKLPNRDEAGAIYHLQDYKNLGRWFLRVPAAISSSFNLPWVNGILSLLYISIAACLIVSCLQMKRLVLCVLADSIMVSFPSVCSTFSYIGFADAYFMGFLIACLAVYIAFKYTYGFLAAIPFIVLSLGIYQAHFAVSATLMIGMLIIDTLKKSSFKQVFFKAMKYVCSLLAGIIIYMQVTKLFYWPLSDYRGLTDIGNINISKFPALIMQAYYEVYAFFFQNSFAFHYPFMKYGFGIILFIFCSLILFIIIKGRIYRSKGSLFLLLALVAVLPLSSNLIIIMSGDENPHLLMLYSLMILFLVVLALINVGIEFVDLEKRYKWVVAGCYWGVGVFFAFCIYNYALVTNESYFRLHMAYEQGYAYGITLISNIEYTEGYLPEDTVVFVGKPVVTDATPDVPELSKITGIDAQLPGTWNYTGFLDQFLGFHQEIITMETAQLKEQGIYEEVEELPLYPAKGSVKKMGGYIVVKFTEL